MGWSLRCSSDVVQDERLRPKRESDRLSTCFDWIEWIRCVELEGEERDKEDSNHNLAYHQTTSSFHHLIIEHGDERILS